MAVVIKGDPKTELISIISNCILEINKELLKCNGNVEHLDIERVGHWGEVIAETSKIYRGVQSIGAMESQNACSLQAYRDFIFQLRHNLDNLRLQNETVINNIVNNIEKLEERLERFEYDFAGGNVKNRLINQCENNPNV